MATIALARKALGIQFTGANSAEILAACQAFYSFTPSLTFTVTNSSGTGFDLNRFDNGNLYSTERISLNDWYVTDYTANLETGMAPAYFAARFYSYEQASELITDTTAFKTALAGTSSAMGATGVTVNGLSNANFDVPIRPMQPSTAFTATPFLTGGASLLGNLAMTGLSGGATGTVQNAQKLSTTIGGVTWYDRVRVNVANSGALQITGANLLVHVSP